ncbi:hypothetical protein BDV06DRAFT_221098 [Aspergillus oleicola]
MARLECPNYIRAILIILSAVSFLPQLVRLWSRKTPTGYSTGYVLLNLFAATEQLTIDVFWMFIVPEDAGGDFIQHPLSTGDWINFAQILTVWVAFNALFITCLSLQPLGTPISGYITAYTLYILISIIPSLIFIQNPSPSTTTDLLQGFIGVHIPFLKPVTTFLIAISALCQTGPIWRYPGPNDSSLSLLGLFTQCLVFGSLGTSWLWRVGEYHRGGWTWASDEWEWYWSIGWPIVDGFLFGSVQGVLGCCVLFNRLKGWRQRWREGKGVGVEGEEENEGGDDEVEATAGEREPLLRGSRS